MADGTRGIGADCRVCAFRSRAKVFCDMLKSSSKYAKRFHKEHPATPSPEPFSSAAKLIRSKCTAADFPELIKQASHKPLRTLVLPGLYMHAWMEGWMDVCRYVGMKVCMHARIDTCMCMSRCIAYA